MYRVEIFIPLHREGRKQVAPPFLCTSDGVCDEDAKAMTVVCCSGNVGCVGWYFFKREAILQLNRLTSA